MKNETRNLIAPLAFAVFIAACGGSSSSTGTGGNSGSTAGTTGTAGTGNTTTGSASYDLGITSTSGIASGTGTYLQYSCNTANVGAGLLLTYTAP